MKVKLNTIFAHPKYGCAEPGQVLDLPDAEANALVEAGAAEAVGHALSTSIPPQGLSRPSSAGDKESTMMDQSKRESAMEPHPHTRSTR